uniref:EF-hand domain-containing protein n=1 Tax=Amphimedon queenslandica TaxID=400682 RepID=A0A1X7U9N3_AMPQE
ELNGACKAITGSSVSSHLVDVLFTIFDENNDGKLSRKEFVHVLKSKKLTQFAK